ncbi:GtrA family protein [Legionella gresilensis]|uniref:GtrA family protein n=1 Tax=Legionella gresilensis TaxID=91823 RepID=UPI001041A6D9|nr:GtrA family protein [Legionella gresilensis]
MYRTGLKQKLGHGLRFLSGGFLNTVLTYAIYFFLKLFINYQWAYLFAYIVGVLFSYSFNAKIVFRVQYSWKIFSFYPLIYLFQYTISSLLLYILVELEQLNDTVAPVIVIAVMVPFSYIMNKIVLLHKIS